MTSAVLKQHYLAGAGALGRWSTLALGAAIPVSVALDNVLLVFVLAAWLAGLSYRAKLTLAWQNPVYRAALLLFGILLLGLFHGDTPRADASLYISKYVDLVLISVLGWIFVSARERAVGLHILAGALTLTLLMSYSLWAGLTPQKLWLHGTPDFPIVFKSRLTHNILMAFAFYLFAWLACGASDRKTKIFWGALAALAVVNVTLMVEGATGHVLLGTLVLLLGWQRARWRGVIIAVIATLAAILALVAIPGPFQTRVKQIASEVKQEHAGRPATTSAGYRMEFYRNTIQLIAKAPVLGSGTGSFPSRYAAHVAGTGQTASRNPHNEFLLIAVQAGIVGLAAFLWLLWQQWRLASQLPTPLEQGLGQGLVVTMIVICMLNSALLDHTEGLLYVWLTALLYAGLSPGPKTAAQSRGQIAG